MSIIPFPIYIPSGRSSGCPPTLLEAMFVAVILLTTVLSAILGTKWFMDWSRGRRHASPVGIRLMAGYVKDDPRLRPLWEEIVADGIITYAEVDRFEDL